jgi:hypothetical protein
MWDPYRKDYYYWDSVAQIWVYQSGRKVMPAARKGNILNSEIPHRIGVGGDSTLSMSNHKTGYAGENSSPAGESILDPGQTITQQVIRRNIADIVNLEYLVRRPGKEFFKVGKVCQQQNPYYT